MQMELAFVVAVTIFPIYEETSGSSVFVVMGTITTRNNKPGSNDVYISPLCVCATYLNPGLLYANVFCSIFCLGAGLYLTGTFL